MKRHVAGIVLALTAAGVIDLHVDWHRTDNGVLLRVGEQDHDPWGELRDRWMRVTRSCQSVAPVQDKELAWTATLAAIRDYSPPDSRSARLLTLSRQGQWLLAQVKSDTLMPAIVTLRQQGNDVAIVPRGIWSGHTAPWVAAPRIREYLQRQVPDLPQALAECLTIHPDWTPAP